MRTCIIWQYFDCIKSKRATKHMKIGDLYKKGHLYNIISDIKDNTYTINPFSKLKEGQSQRSRSQAKSFGIINYKKCTCSIKV